MARTPGRSGPIGIIVMVVGIIFAVAGVATYVLVANELAAENIVVSDDAEYFAGQPVNSPWTAYSEAETISKHALKATDGKTYAELAQDDPLRETAMQGRSCGPRCSPRSSRSASRRWRRCSASRCSSSGCRCAGSDGRPPSKPLTPATERRRAGCHKAARSDRNRLVDARHAFSRGDGTRTQPQERAQVDQLGRRARREVGEHRGAHDVGTVLTP
jgi:hypothetical protein